MVLFVVEVVDDPITKEVALAEVEADETDDDGMLETNEVVVELDEDDEAESTDDDDETEDEDAALELDVAIDGCGNVLLEIAEVAMTEGVDAVLDPDVSDVAVELDDESMVVALVTGDREESEEAAEVLD